MIFPYKFIDLTHVLDTSIPTWSAQCGFHHDIYKNYSDCSGEDKFRVMKVAMYAGIGTHMDAPSHCIEGAANIHDFDLNQLIQACFVLDISDICHERYSLSVEDIINFERQHGSITAGSCVIVKTGWSMYWKDPVKYHNNHVFPSVSHQAAQLLLERGVAALGIDTLSLDRPEDGFKVHQAFLGAGKFLLENVANLEHMPPTGSFVITFPLNIKDGTEAPVRLAGLVKK